MNRKGFTPIFIVIIAVLIIGGGAVYFVAKKKQATSPIPVTPPIAQNRGPQVDTSSWKKYVNSNFSLQYPNNVILDTRNGSDPEKFLRLYTEQKRNCPKDTRCMSGIQDEVLWIETKNNPGSLDEAVKNSGLYKGTNGIAEKSNIVLAGESALKVIFCEGKTANDKSCSSNLPPEYFMIHHNKFFEISSFENRGSLGQQILFTLSFVKETLTNVILKGTVIENNKGCASDGGCVLVIQADDGKKINAYYGGGLAPNNDACYRSEGFQFAQGDRIEVSGKFSDQNTLSLCEPDSYMRKAQ